MASLLTNGISRLTSQPLRERDPHKGFLPKLESSKLELSMKQVPPRSGRTQLFYFQQRGIDYEKAMAAMISCFCKDVFNDEFGAEVNQLMSLKLEV